MTTATAARAADGRGAGREALGREGEEDGERRAPETKRDSGFDRLLKRDAVLRVRCIVHVQGQGSLLHLAAILDAVDVRRHALLVRSLGLAVGGVARAPLALLGLDVALVEEVGLALQQGRQAPHAGLVRGCVKGHKVVVHVVAHVRVRGHRVAITVERKHLQ